MGKKGDGKGKGKGKGKGVSSQEETSAPPPLERCPRCNSMNTKFCYNNNYNTAQPRHYCNDCRRYWTVGGSQRDIPVGGSSRKDKRWLKSSKDKTSQKGVNLRWSDMAIPPLVSGLVGGGPGSSHYFPSTGTSRPVPQVQPFNQPFAGGSNHFAVLQGNNLQAFQQQPRQNQPPLVPRNQINRPPQPSQQNHQLMNNMPQVSHQNLGGGLINSANNLLFGTAYANNNIYSTALYPDPAFPQPAHATPGTPTMNNLTGFTSAPPVQDPYGSSLDHVNTLGGNNSAIDMSFYDSLPSLDPTSHHDPSIFDPQGDFGSPYNTLDFDPSFPDLPPFDPPY